MGNWFFAVEESSKNESATLGVNCMIHFNARRQKVLSLSSTDAETTAVVDGLRQVDEMVSIIDFPHVT